MKKNYKDKNCLDCQNPCSGFRCRPCSYNHYDFPKRNTLTEEELARRIRSRKLERTYGITLDQYEEMLDQQGGVCAICKQPENYHYKRNLSVDHNHETGEVRGLLCHKCNTGIGKFNDSQELLISASEYLKFYDGED